MVNENFKIQIPFDEFQKHLDLENNHRIIFSGIFGIGKTTYIRDFFEQDKNSDKSKYVAIHLFPVNYSVANNKDIFELVKFDILFQLLNEDVDFDKIDYQKDLLLTQFVKDNFIEVLEPFINIIPIIGGKISKITEKLLKLKSKYEKFKESLEKNDLELSRRFLESFINLKGCIYEEDFYTNLVQNLINQLQTNNKQVILIIDDFDRIDPEHIFRLLNIFAAQVDINYEDEKENKFGFEKVIFVCDIANIKNIYKHKYGIKTDFNGYIDKFFSREIFDFNAETIITNYLDEFLRGIKIKNSNHFINFYDEGSGQIFNFELKFILTTMLKIKVINLRDLFRHYKKKDLIINKYDIVQFEQPFIYNTSINLIQVYDILKIIFGYNLGKLFLALEKCKSAKSKVLSKGMLNRMIGDTLLILDSRKHRFNENNLDKSSLNAFDFENIKYSIQHNYNSKGNELFFGELVGMNINYDSINYFDLLYRSLKKISEPFSKI